MEIVEFSRFGISFKRLTEENLEMVRIWRNSDDVRLFMQYQEIITSAQQKEWFRQLDKAANFYFITYQNRTPFGVYNIKEVNFNLKTGETGAYLKNKEIWETGISMRGSLATIIFAFEKLKLDILICHVLKSNKKVLAYNKQLGFQINEKVQNSISFELILNKEDFYTNKKIVRLVTYLETN